MQIRFSYETKYGVYGDALNLPDDHTFTDEEIEAMKEQRRDNWIKVIETPAPEVPAEETPPTEEPTPE